MRYRANVLKWIETLDLDPALDSPRRTFRAVVFDRYRYWCHLNDIEPTTKTRLFREMREAGLIETALSGRRGFRGMDLAPLTAAEYEAMDGPAPVLPSWESMIPKATPALPEVRLHWPTLVTNASDGF